MLPQYPRVTICGMETPTPKCLICKERPPEKRGVCQRCFMRISRLRWAGAITDKRLVRLGWLLPSLKRKLTVKELARRMAEADTKAG